MALTFEFSDLEGVPLRRDERGLFVDPSGTLFEKSRVLTGATPISKEEYDKRVPKVSKGKCFTGSSTS